MNSSKQDANSMGKLSVNTDTSNYRSIFKATSIFGGVQVFQIIIGILKSKCIAVLLGPAGMGIMGLYNSILSLVHGFTSLGLAQSAVRDVSESSGEGNQDKIDYTIAIIKKLMWITGLLGMVAMIVFSPILSKTTFGNNDYVIPIIVVSVVKLLDQLSAGQNVILQGLRKLKYLAKASVIGSSCGLLVSIPLYYLLGVRGIVPTLVLNSITTLTLTWYYSRKVSVNKVYVSTKDAIHDGRQMIKMGIALSVSNILVMSFAYILRSFIRANGGVEEVGLFTAGFVVTNTYVGMVFTAMGTDYYPRLSSLNKDNEKCVKAVNSQGEIALLIISPLIVSCFVFIPFLIPLIYSEDFLPATDYILWAIVGMLFKAVSWSIAFLFLAKAESRLFVINETISNLYVLALNLIGYKVAGLTGLGVSMLIGNGIYLLQVWLIANKRYGYHFSYSLRNILYAQILFVLGMLLSNILIETQWLYIPSMVILVGCCAFSFISLNRRLELNKIFKKKL